MQSTYSVLFCPFLVSIKNKCQLLDEDEEMVKYVPAIVSHSVEIFNYEPSTGRFGTSFPSQPTLRRENVILPTLVCGLHGSLTFASATGVDALGRLHHVGEEVVDMLPGTSVISSLLQVLPT